MPWSRLLTVAVFALAGCGVRTPTPLDGEHAAPGVAYPFAPQAMRIHPLTRIDRDSRGVVWILCHVELTDAWGDSCKGTGKLQVQLYKPVGGRASGLGEQELTWDIDLGDLSKNASFYDAATRTYRFPLQNAPAWVGGAVGREDPGVRVRLRAVLTTTGVKGEEHVLQDEYVIGG